MSKTKKITLNIITVTLFNFLFWFSNHYPKHIFQVNTTFLIGAHILNLIYFIFYFLGLSIIFTKDKTLFSKQIFNVFEPITKRFNIWKIIILLVTQILIDVLRVTLSLNFNSYVYIISDVFVLLNWFVIYLVLANREQNIFKNKKVCLISLALVVLAFGILIVFDIDSTNYYFNILSKYNPDSYQLAYEIRNLNFIQELRILIFDCVIGAILIISHTFVIPQEKSDKGKVFPFLIRIAVLIFGVFVIPYFAKLLIYPMSQLFYFPLGSSYSIYYKLDGTFHDKTRSMCFARIGQLEGGYYYGYSYCCEISEIQNDNKTIATIYFPSEDNYVSFKNIDGVIEEAGNFVDYYVGDELVQIYRNTAICFKENGKPRVVKFNEIKTCEENNIVTNICEQLISEGNIVAFEYSCDYLLRYDREFIEPYITRYASGNFTSNELQFIEKTHYRSEYISNIAKNLIMEH